MPLIPMDSRAAIVRRSTTPNSASPRDEVSERTVASDVPCHTTERVVQLETAEGGYAVANITVARFHGSQDVKVSDFVTIASRTYRVLSAPRQGPFVVATMEFAE